MSQIQIPEKIIDLHTFVSQAAFKRQPQSQHNKSKQTKNSRQFEEKSFNSLGFSTLLHFNNQSFSSVRSNKQSISSIRVKNFVDEAKREVQELRAKRLQLEQEWKYKKSRLYLNKYERQIANKEDLQNEENEINESHVEQYDSGIYNSVYPQSMTKGYKEEPLILQLRIDILRSKAEKFLLSMKKAFASIFIRQLKMFNTLTNFKQSQNARIKSETFHAWNDLASRLGQRQRLRQLIVQKLKKRRQLRELETEGEVYIRNL